MKGLVYTIRSKSSELVYYGSTIEKMLSNRMGNHRAKYKQWLAGKTNNCTSFQILALGDAYIELVEEVEVESKQHLRALEGKYQRENDCVNKCIEGRTPAERKEYSAAYNAMPQARAVRAAYAKTPKAKVLKAAYMKTPEIKAAQLAYRATPEFKAMQATTEYKAAKKAYHAAYNATPERKAARAAAYQKRKALLN
jgi:hypothetical protein